MAKVRRRIHIRLNAEADEMQVVDDDTHEVLVTACTIAELRKEAEDYGLDLDLSTLGVLNNPPSNEAPSPNNEDVPSLVKFKCPQCGGTELQEVLDGVVTVAEITRLFSNGTCDYGKTTDEGDYIPSYECAGRDCSYTVPDAFDLDSLVSELRTTERNERELEEERKENT